MKKVKLRKLLYSLLIAPSVLSIFLFSGCSADLGIFNDKEHGIDNFYESLDGSIKAKFEGASDIEEAEYDVKKSITNDYIMDNLSWEDGADKVLYRQYSYIVIPFKRDLKIESLALYLASDMSEPNVANLEISAFYFKDSDSCPKDEDLKLKADPDTKIITEKDEHGNDVEKEVEVEYADPKKELRVSYTTMTITHSFDGFMLNNFHQTEVGDSYVSDNCLLVKNGSYLYIRIENNSPINRNMTPISISFINLLIRAI